MHQFMKVDILDQTLSNFNIQGSRTTERPNNEKREGNDTIDVLAKSFI